MTTKRQPRVILVDDHPVVMRQALATLASEFDVVDALEDGTELAASIVAHEPDLLVLDITLPGENGIEIAARIKNAGFRAKVVFLTVHSDPDYARAAFAAGALGYVVKPHLASDLAPALRAAMGGKRFVSPCPELDEVR
jgi:two-component system response regulator DesR